MRIFSSFQQMIKPNKNCLLMTYAIISVINDPPIADRLQSIRQVNKEAKRPPVYVNLSVNARLQKIIKTIKLLI